MSEIRKSYRFNRFRVGRARAAWAAVRRRRVIGPGGVVHNVPAIRREDQ
jgi:hypothetical protein